MLRRAGLSAVLALVLLLVLLLNKVGVLAPDIKPEIYLAPWREAEALSRAWRESPKLGEPNFNVGLFPVAWVVGLVQMTGVGPDLSMRLLRWILLLVGAWGASRLYGLVAGSRARRSGHVAVAVLYVANPYSVTAGDFLANVLPAAMLPWMALFLLRACVVGGWRYPAAAALAFAAMSGMNVAVIPLIQLLCLPALLWYAHAGLGVGWRRVAAATARWALLAGLLSAYWLVPSVAALGAGSHVTQFSESLEGIAAPSSYAEVVRGLGLWPLYGSDVDGAWQPGFASYLTNPFVVAASFVLPILLVATAPLVRGPARRLGLLLVVPATVLMVGAHPADHPTPFGELLLWAFEHVPGAAAFRTTNKVGAVLVLGVALLVALAAPALARRAQRLAPRPVIATAATGVLVLATWPAWTGGLYSLPLPVPDYWYDAAEELDEGPADQRVWFVPGVAQPQYTWSEDRPDDLNNAVLARPSFVRITLPESSPYGASLLAALDTQLQEDTLRPGTLSAAARYLGVGDVLVRNDVRWDKAGGARPLTVATQVGADPGLGFADSYGEPGQGLVRTFGQSEQELGLPPLQHYEVREPRDLVRTESAEGLVLVDGDGWAMAPVAQAGLLPFEPPYLLTGAASDASLPDLLGPRSRLVLTDTNRRREVAPNRLTDAYGPLLAADEPLGPSISLFDAARQTVLDVDGGVVTASQVGPLFGVDAAASAEHAFDGDPSTAWGFGDFGRGLDQSITVRPDRPVPVDQVFLDIPPTTGQRIARVEVRADDEVREVRVPADGRVGVRFPGRTAGRITVTVTEVEGAGNNPLFVAEVTVPGLQVRRAARLPLSTARLADDLDSAGLALLSSTPLDVVMTRVLGKAEPGDDEEARLDRDFVLPDARDYRVYGVVRPDRGAPDELLDARLGLGSGDVVVTSSSRAFHGVEVRGSMAFDGDRATGWVPGRSITGEWLQARFPRPRQVSEVVVEQRANAQGWISEAEISIDGRVVATAELDRKRVVVPVPASEASTVRIRVTERQGDGLPSLSEVGIAGVTMASTPGRASRRCVTLGTVDGAPLRARIVGGVEGEGPRTFQGCDPLPLGSGEHELRSDPGWTIDTLVLRDARGEFALSGRPGPAVTVDRRSSSSYRVVADAATTPYFLVVGQNHHPLWRATMDGVDLGPPEVLDGYALGWRVDDLGPHAFTIEYSPQPASDVALAVSGLAAVGSVALLVPRRRTPAPGRQPAPARRAGGRGSSRWSRQGPWLARASFVVGCWFFAGSVGLVTGAAVIAWTVLGSPRPRALLRLAAVVMALVPAAWILGNLDTWGEVGPQLVVGNQAPSVLVVVSLVLLLVGSWREDEAT